ncbi:cytochrome b/b6 domain-containing protein [Amaricoccus sp.]|uniref:cytochrome b/b6 domain-containing protein n=1 Tax=Amaricoccus sp. TaxID=1872485 RepID=UPI0026115C15|nr:cytochrome b/b6 domain-containing protein [Amaricoccus sp.]HRO12151.1 cytochrome b/b6 domain-containing protein [Amaricoccus sp.]
MSGAVAGHRLSTRLWHWVNAAVFFVLLMSGLMIFNAHPRLYWGEYGADYDPAWLEIGADAGRGYLRVGEVQIDTTGVLGTSRTKGRVWNVAFPGWATIPSTYDLALARRWHLSFAWLLALGLAGYAGWSLVNGHLRRDLVPRAAEVAPGNLRAEIGRHLRLDFPRDRYNVLQKLAYLVVLLVLLPLMVLSGLTMSPSMDATWPWLLDLFGGRQTARSVHFILAWTLVGFLLVHLAMLLLAGPVGRVGAMITGRRRAPGEGG